jgi:hypothetical protein
VLAWDLIEEGFGPFETGNAGARMAVQVRAPEARAAWDEVRAERSMTADVRGIAAVKVSNVGTIAWPAHGRGAITLSYHWRDRNGRVVVWDGERTGFDHAVLPGESVDLELRVLPPPEPGAYVLEIDAVREGAAWFGGGPRVEVEVRAPSYAATFSGLKAPARVSLGAKLDLAFTVKNTGETPWTNGARRTLLAYHLLDAAGRLVLWDGPRTELGRLVRPGEEIEVRPNAYAPDEPGRYTLQFDLVRDGVTWFGHWNRSLQVTIEVAPLAFHAHFEAVQASAVMATGLDYTVRATIVNTDRVAWPSAGFAPVRLAQHWVDARGRAIVWDGVRRELEHEVKPGERLELALDVVAPEQPGRYTLVLDMVQEGVSWFARHGTIPGKVAVTVVKPSFSAAFLNRTLPTSLRAGGIASARINVRNDSPFTWTREGDHPVRLAHHWRIDDGRVAVWDGFRSELPRDVAPGETVEVEVWFFAPARPGRYVLEVDVVQEDVTWFSERGSPLLAGTVEVLP